MPVGSPVWALTALDRKQAGLSPENRKRRICHGRDHGREKGADPGGDSRSGVTGDPGEKAGKSTADKKKRRRTIRRIVALVVVAALIAGGVKFFKRRTAAAR